MSAVKYLVANGKMTKLEAAIAVIDLTWNKEFGEQAAAEYAALLQRAETAEAELARVRAAAKRADTQMSYCARYVDGREYDDFISALSELQAALEKQEPQADGR